MVYVIVSVRHVMVKVADNVILVKTVKTVTIFKEAGAQDNVVRDIGRIS